MSSVSSGHGGSNGQDFELNLASIIDCFTVLIAFMLASASFLSIGVLDAGVAAAGASASPGAPPEIMLNLELKQDHSIVVKLSGKASSSSTLKAGQEKGAQAWDIPALERNLAELKKRWPTLGAATLVAENQIEYRDIVQIMETTRKQVPAVLLGGF